MKKTFKLKNLALSLAVAGAASVAMVPAASQAGVSANVGVFTDYVFRGLNQAADKGTPALQGGFDYEHDSGLFAGVWGSTMDQGFEYDLYAGWGGSFEGVDLGIGYISYMYSEDVGEADSGSSAFEEINLSAGYGPISIGYDLGTDNTVASTDEDKYVHYSVSADMGAIAEGVSLTYGATKYDGADDASGYFDIGYATTLDMGVDLGVNMILSDANTDDTTYFVVGLSKSFDLM